MGEVSLGGNRCNEQMKIKSNEFCDQVISVDKQWEYNDCSAREVGTCDRLIKEETTYNIKMGTEGDRLKCTWLEVGKCEDFGQATAKSDDLSNKPVFDDDHTEHKVIKVEKYENDIKEENVEELLTDSKSFSEDLSTEFICKDDPESSAVDCFKCDSCEYKAKCKATLRAHVRSKHNPNASWHNCQLCEYKTKIQRYLKQHIRYKHGKFADWYHCQFCQLKTESKHNLKNHLKVMHDVDVIWHQCPHCKFTTKYKYSFEAHLANKHKIIDKKWKLQQCQFCDYITVRTLSLKQHLKRKHSQKIVWHRCQYCRFRTEYKYSLEVHLENHAQNAVWHQCRQCLFKTENEDALTRHVACEHQSPNESKVSQNCEAYQCRLCEFKAKKQCFLTRHFTNVHDKNIELYKCLLCNFKTEDKFKHTLHFKKTHPLFTCSLKQLSNTKHDQKNEDTLARHITYKHKSPSKSKDTENCEHYQCRLCNFKTDTQHVLIRHFTNVHDKNMESYDCLLCDFKTEDRLGLTLHFKKNHPLHKFSLKQLLETHHDLRKWHQCQQCLFKTKNEDTLARHIVCKHESPNKSKGTENWEHYQCRLCKFETDKQRALTRHFTSVHHKIPELYKCLLCDFKTEDKSGLSLHFKKNHPVSAN